MTRDILNAIIDGRRLSAPESESLFGNIFSGAWDAARIGALLTAMAQRGETQDELLGAVRAMRAHMRPINAPQDALDCCGTGGDATISGGTLNVSTAVGFVLAALGVPVAKHGNRAASSRSGAADVLEALGVPLSDDTAALERALKDTGFCFLMAPHHHPAMRHVAPVRKALGFRTIFNMMGPLSNPAGVKYQLVGVFDRALLTPMAQALRALGTKRAYVVHGRDGLDEITVSDVTDMVRLDADGSITQDTLDPRDYGLPLHGLAALRGGDAAHNGAAMRQLLDPEYAGGPLDAPAFAAYRDIVTLNAAAALVIAGKAPDMTAAFPMAAEALRQGAAWKKIGDYIRALSG